MLLRRNRKKAIPSPGNGSRDLVQHTGCCNAGNPRTPALTLPAGTRGQEKRQQVIPALSATGPTLAVIIKNFSQAAFDF